MAKLLILACFVLFLTLSKASPISDADGIKKDGDNINDIEEDDDQNGEKKVKYDDEDDDDFQGIVGVEKVSDNDPAEKDNEDEDDETIDDNAGEQLKQSGVVEDSNGAVRIEGKRQEDDDAADDKEELEDELDGVDIQDDGEKLTSITEGISKLQAIFDDEMPKEIDNLKSESAKLMDDLAKLNERLDDFLKHNKETTQAEVTINNTNDGDDTTQQDTYNQATNNQSENEKEYDPTVDDIDPQSDDNTNKYGEMPEEEMPGEEMQRMIDNVNANGA